MRLLVVFALLAPAVAAAATPVCVDVEVKSWTARGQEDSTEPDADVPPDPYAIDPARYLERMVRYEVTHERGFEAVEQDCKERLTVELYPLRSGWTVFGRYTGSSREEKIDHVQLDEFVSLAQRISRALLRDQPITDTITRENVLRDDSEADLRTIRGDGHFVMALGGELRVGEMPTIADSGTADELRFLTPLSVHLGYRGKYQAWGLDAFVRGSIGTNKRAERRNPEGGHVDYDGGLGLGLHFLRYLNAGGMTSLYFGGGAQFRLSAFSVINAEADRAEKNDRETLYGGGLDASLLFGMEFMRASSVHFFWQLEAHAPAYKFDTEVDAGGLDTWMPGGLFQIGMVF